MTWHYEKNGIRHDNVTEDDITGLIKRGELTAATLVWQQGMPDWQPVSATPLASALLHSTTPPALPGNRIPGGVIWTLAFAPFIGYALELWTAGLNGMSFDEAYEAVSGGQYWFITLLLNIALGYLDERRLRKAGVDTTMFGKLAWLVPFYLWRRAKTLSQKPAYFWVWLVMLALTVWA
ncbi:TPA: DUF4339 domain-containing protein [Citrobacter koseri]|uniref:DUF4339 domain-containing protein n=1 Tax=Citrobacter koseri TaxID=545 RepID=UPI00190275C6|nr:DUF4339 domain-containing protein [Citrobacter koseri]MBJ8984538.1 DUF4339 domain-containing protein [Citrobacter koseri]MBJ9007884.1 DUF4339 domain-containing protein [Citrobacter koseri]MBJ9279518.1 DUF4339 domain-containing protein [Citrobacter koseri]HAT3725833.1 DUF4339 domain-containing protein [Citrobacter koseri]HAT3930117.1 DUF4339 domain-containing protein [Citrobacter koseri]